MNVKILKTLLENCPDYATIHFFAYKDSEYHAITNFEHIPATEEQQRRNFGYDHGQVHIGIGNPRGSI